MNPRPLWKPTHFTSELGAISYLLHLRWDVHTHTHTYTTDQETHVLTQISNSREHICSARKISFCPPTHIPHVYPITEAPRLSLQAEKPNLFIPVGIIGRGRGWNASNRVQRPLFQSSLITAPPQPPSTLQYHHLPELGYNELEWS